MIYADYNASYPLTSGHLEAVCKRLASVGANPSSIHAGGRASKLALEEARERVAMLFGCKRHNIVFTSGATESNNWVIRGVASAHAGSAQTVVCTAAEHPSVLVTFDWLNKKELAQSIRVPCNKNGTVNRDQLLAAVGPNTSLVCLIHANNEVGAINQVFELAKDVRMKSPKAHIHVDGVQAFGKIDLQGIEASAIDSYAISGHKIGAFTGVGGLYLRTPSANLESLVTGGSQERGLRAGTENLPGAVSFGLRCQHISENPDWLLHLGPLKKRFMQGFADKPQVVFHNEADVGLNNTVNFHIQDASLAKILCALDIENICVSSQSACSSGQMKASHVLLAMGYDAWVGANSIRVSLGEGSQAEDVDRIVAAIRPLL